MTDPVSASELLCPGLLQGVTLLVAGPSAPLGDAVARVFTELGAGLCRCLPNGADEAAIDQAVTDALAELGAIDVLVVDGAALFDEGASDALRVDGAALFDEGASDALRVDGAALFDEGASDALRACLDAAWNVTRAVVNLAFLTDERDPAAKRVIYLAPSADAGEQAHAARAGLENLARTLSVEWARHGINTLAIAPGATTPAAEVAALAAYLASPAGAYFSGCLLDLGGAPAAGMPG